MDKNRLLMLLIGLGAVAVLAGGFVLGIQPSLQAAAASDAARQQAVTTNALNQRTLDALIAQNKKVGELTGQLEKLRLSVPSAENMPVFIDAVRDAAAQGLIEARNPEAKARALFACYQGTMAQARIQNDVEVLREFKNVARDVLGVKRARSAAV